MASVANGGVVVFNSLLLPGTYQLCEVIPEGYVPSCIWGAYGVQWWKPGYAPGQGGLDPIISVCVNFTVLTSGSINFQVDYPTNIATERTQVVPAGGSIMINNVVGQMQRTIGY